MSTAPMSTLHARALGDERPQAVGERDAAGVDADERELVEVGVALDQLVRDPGERSLDCRRVEQDLGRLAAGGVHRHRSPFRPRCAGLKGLGECRRRARRRPQRRRLSSAGAADDDQAVEPGHDPVRQLALGARRALLDLLLAEQVEGRDVPAADPRERLLAAELALGRQPCASRRAGSRPRAARAPAPPASGTAARRSS